jgi:CBS domain-containing protein
MTCKEVMTPNPRSCMSYASPQAAAWIMKEENVALVPVIDEKTLKFAGVVTDRTLIALIAEAGDAQLLHLSDVMIRRPLICKPDDDIRFCERQMKDHQIDRIPVVDDNGFCVGIISQQDLVSQASRAIVARRGRDEAREATSLLSTASLQL